MTQQLINIGSTANDKTGDPLRLAFEKINNNFTQLYSIAGGAGAAAGVDGSIQFRATNNLNAVAYINNVWVAFSTPKKYFMSYDGTIWTNTDYPSAQQIRAVYAAPFGLVAVGDAGTIITSTDNGVTWTAQTSGTVENLYAVRYDAATDIFIAVGANGKILISPDAVSWVSQASGVIENLYAVAYNQIGAGYVVVGALGTVLISAAGTSWTTESSGVTTDLRGLSRRSAIHRNRCQWCHSGIYQRYHMVCSCSSDNRVTQRNRHGKHSKRSNTSDGWSKRCIVRIN